MATSMQAGARVDPRWRAAIWGGAAALLLLPAMAMRLGAEGVHWTAGDFAVMGAMLATACGGWELAMRMSAGSPAYRLAACIAIGCGFLLVWVELAVGIVGEPDHPANLAFLGVIVVAIGGALLARLRAAGLARAMWAAAAMQAVAGVVALAAGSPEGAGFGLLLAPFWGASALLFRRAAR